MFQIGDSVLVPFYEMVGPDGGKSVKEYWEGTIINLYVPVKTGKKGRPRIDMIVVIDGTEYQVTRKEVKKVKGV